MRLLLNWLVAIFTSVTVSLGLLLFMTYRLMGGLSETEAQARWLILLASQNSFALWVRDLLGNMPPIWAQRLAIVWDKADPITWWWLPLLFLATRWLVFRWGRKRTPMDDFR